MDIKYQGRYKEYQRKYHLLQKNDLDYKKRRYKVARKYIERNQKKVSEYHKKYNHEWYLKNKDSEKFKEKQREKNRRYDERHKAERYLKNKIWRMAHSERWKKYALTKEWYARQKTYRAVKSGKIKRLPCAICGNTTTEMHHPDYNKPFLVVHLCKPCHSKLHRLR